LSPGVFDRCEEIEVMTEQTVQPGKYVALTYVIEDAQGELLERRDTPLGFVYGSDTELIGGMDQAVAGLGVGDEVEVRVPPGQGVADYDPALVFVEDIDNVPQAFQHVGAEVQMTNERGETRSFFVTRIEDGKITVDGNHPLAGRDLKVRVTITEVRDAEPGEAEVSGIHATQIQGPTTVN
jgi:FKBP-type peptidyl-prolyl cis-trans isomerase SlyD